MENSAFRFDDVRVRPDDNISDIAYSVGFSNVSYFDRLFKSKYSRTPTYLRPTSPPHL